MAKINVVKRNGVTVALDGAVGRTLMENLRDNDMDIEAICGGACSCATCHVFIGDAWIAKTGNAGPDETELLEASASYDRARSRLSCQIKFTEALDGISVTVAPAE